MLPFGLSSACYAFTKIVRPLVKHWRSQGICSIVYLDDGIAGSRHENAKIISEIVKQDIDKSVLELERMAQFTAITGQSLIVRNLSLTTIMDRSIETKSF